MHPRLFITESFQRFAIAVFCLENESRATRFRYMEGLFFTQQFSGLSKPVPALGNKGITFFSDKVLTFIQKNNLS